MPLTDEEIQRNVLEQFKWDARISPTEIGVTVKDGVVTLVGTVESYTKKWSAEEVALRVAGVKAVVNQLEVKPKMLKPDDLKRRIEEALVRTAETDAKNIQVDDRDGKVVLKGRVHSWYEKEEAKREAWLAPGVRDVIDELVITT